jgi:hypothetical protein
LHASRLIQFYLGEVPDSAGRTIHDILNFSRQELESVHDYIQWLFPVRERSQFNPSAPVLSEQDIALFCGTEVLKARLKRAFEKMLDFYGFEFREGNVVRSAEWDQRKRWLAPYNHNFLRITRILTSLRLLGLAAHAQTFYLALRDVHQDYADRIGGDTWRFWTTAAGEQHANTGPPNEKTWRNDS